MPLSVTDAQPCDGEGPLLVPSPAAPATMICGPESLKEHAWPLGLRHKPSKWFSVPPWQQQVEDAYSFIWVPLGRLCSVGAPLADLTEFRL